MRLRSVVRRPRVAAHGALAVDPREPERDRSSERDRFPLRTRVDAFDELQETRAVTSAQQAGADERETDQHAEHRERHCCHPPRWHPTTVESTTTGIVPPVQ